MINFNIFGEWSKFLFQPNHLGIISDFTVYCKLIPNCLYYKQQSSNNEQIICQFYKSSFDGTCVLGFCHIV